ncbi:MAG: hypothetical protein GY865_06095 [candidate division Zixibacteria bacterium]|nr:hypothetical protein [candidate division Zixibacteria bacterium]
MAHLSSLVKPTTVDLIDLNSMPFNSISKSGLMAALLHKISSDNNQFPWDIVKLPEPSKINTSVTVCISDPDTMLDELKQSAYSIIKLKLGFDGDEKVVEELKHITGKIIRIDANGGWSVEKAEKMIYNLNKCGVELIEQPTTIDYISDWKHLKGSAKSLLIVDEGLNDLNDYYKVADYVDGVNVKLSKSGGIITAKDICRQARKDKLKVMIGCMVESSIGISQAVYLSSMADYFDLDGPILLKNDISSDIEYNMEKISLNSNIIGGPKIENEYLKM